MIDLLAHSVNFVYIYLILWHFLFKFSFKFVFLIKFIISQSRSRFKYFSMPSDLLHAVHENKTPSNKNIQLTHDMSLNKDRRIQLFDCVARKIYHKWRLKSNFQIENVSIFRVIVSVFSRYAIKLHLHFYHCILLHTKWYFVIVYC